MSPNKSKVGAFFIEGSIKVFLKKKLGYTWRRFRKCVKKCQDPEKYLSKVNELCQLLSLEESGYLNIYYGDESGISLDPYIPYGWQPKGEYIKIAPKKSQRLNVFGLLSRDNNLQAYTTTGTICTDLVVAFLDEISETITQKTVVVLDNAPIHRSDKFKVKIKEWGQKTCIYFSCQPIARI